MLLAAAGIFFTVPAAFAQDVPAMAPNADPSFEVATIKPSDPTDQSSGFHTDGHRLFVENESLNTILSVAYNIQASQIVGAPSWFANDCYDIHGVPDLPGQPSWKQQQHMLQKLLADRFKLTFHREKRELAIYNVTVLKTGPKLTPTKSDPNSLPDQTGNGGNNRQDWAFTNCSMADFAGSMQLMLPRPVVDATGLTGKFDFHLTWTPNPGSTDTPDAPPGLFTAVQEQLGLKLEPTKAPAEVLVIDHVERPSEN
jgi:uncharacterized protein (TIGR03435 family)